MTEAIIGAVIALIALIFGRNLFIKTIVTKKAEYLEKDAELKAEQLVQEEEVKRLEERIATVRKKLKLVKPQDVDDYFNSKYDNKND